MKKGYKLRTEAKMIICIMFILIACILLNNQKNNIEKEAIERCGGEDKISLKYTNTGDRYYVCK